MRMGLRLEMWPLRATLLVLCFSGYCCGSCNETTAYFESRNFHHVLHWDEVAPGHVTLYSVEYHIYGEPMGPMMECQNITVTHCDLSSVLTNIHGRYYTRVKVGQQCVAQSSSFIPIQHTTLGAPDLSVQTDSSSLTVIINTPAGPDHQSFNEICQAMGKPAINYIIHLTHPESKTGKVFTNTSGTVTISHLESHVEYCGVVLYQFTHPSSNKLSENATFCATLPGKPWMHVLLVPSLMSLFLLACFALVRCQMYVTRKSKLPKVLIILTSDTHAVYPNHNEEIHKVTTYPDFSWNPDKPDPGSTPVLNISVVKIDGGSYAAQNRADPTWHCHSYTNQQGALAENHDTSDETSTSYTMVRVMDPQEAEDSTHPSDVATTEESGFSGSTSSCAEEDEDKVFNSISSDKEPGSEGSGFAVLPVSRDREGKLRFSGSLFQSGLLSTLDIVLGSDSTPLTTRERTLDDLVIVDKSGWQNRDLSSGYGRVYLPHQISQNFVESSSSESIPLVSLSDSTSNYRQNWVPGITPEPQSIHTNYITRTEQVPEVY